MAVKRVDEINNQPLTCLRRDCVEKTVLSYRQPLDHKLELMDYEEFSRCLRLF